VTTGQQWLMRVLLVCLGLGVIDALTAAHLELLSVQYVEPSRAEAAVVALHLAALRAAPFLIVGTMVVPSVACVAWLVMRWLGKTWHTNRRVLPAWGIVFALSCAALGLVYWQLAVAKRSPPYALALAAFISLAWSEAALLLNSLQLLEQERNARGWRRSYASWVAAAGLVFAVGPFGIALISVPAAAWLSSRSRTGEQPS
jgi:hypothetical protein